MERTREAYRGECVREARRLGNDSLAEQMLADPTFYISEYLRELQSLSRSAPRRVSRAVRRRLRS